MMLCVTRPSMGSDQGSFAGLAEYAVDDRWFVGAVLYRYRAGILLWDSSKRFGDWKNTH